MKTEKKTLHKYHTVSRAELYEDNAGGLMLFVFARNGRVKYAHSYDGGKIWQYAAADIDCLTRDDVTHVANWDNCDKPVTELGQRNLSDIYHDYTDDEKWGCETPVLIALLDKTGLFISGRGGNTAEKFREILADLQSEGG